MPETNTIRGDVDAFQRLVDRLVTAVPEEENWCYSKIQETAQDQAVIKAFRGRKVETYYGLKRSDEDIQSDTVGLLFPESGREVMHVVLRAIVSVCAATKLWGQEESTEQQTPSHAPGRLGSTEDADRSLTAGDRLDEWTPDRLAEALLNSDPENDRTYLRELIFLAEDTGFTPQQSKKLAPRLLGLAMQYRDSRDPQDKPAVWSAIRTGASVLRPNEIGRLRPLLEPGHPVETSLVAVKMLGRIFEAQPPAGVDQYPELAAEVRQIAESLLNRYAIASSQSAALAQLAIYALAAMASSATVEIAKAARSLGLSWFTAQTGRELRELREYWKDQPNPIAAGPRELLEQAIRELNAD